MKIFKKAYLSIFLLVWACLYLHAQRISTLDTQFPTDRRLAAEPDEVHSLSATERDVIYLLNLARLSPAIFADTYLEYFITQHQLDRENAYVKSLWKTLKLGRPVSPLFADKKMIPAAKCRAKELGGEISLSHEKKQNATPTYQDEGIIPRRNPAPPTKNKPTPSGCSFEFDYYAECYAIGKETSLQIVFQLLLDFDNKTYSNRQICLSNDFSKVGICICPHEHHQTLAVIDFK